MDGVCPAYGPAEVAVARSFRDVHPTRGGDRGMRELAAGIRGIEGGARTPSHVTRPPLGDWGHGGVAQLTQGVAASQQFAFHGQGGAFAV